MARLTAVALAMLVLVASGFGGILFASAPAAGATTLIVDDGSDCNVSGSNGYQNISTAVGNAASGDRIVVCPGAYNESVTVDKSLTIVANDTNGAVVLDGDNRTDSAFVVQADDTVIKDFEIRYYESTTQTEGHGVLVTGTATRNVSVSGADVHDMGGAGVAAVASAGDTYEELAVVDSQFRAVNESGVALVNVRQVVLSNNTYAGETGVLGNPGGTTAAVQLATDASAGAGTLEEVVVNESDVTGIYQSGGIAVQPSASNSNTATVDNISVNNNTVTATVDTSAVSLSSRATGTSLVDLANVSLSDNTIDLGTTATGVSVTAAGNTDAELVKIDNSTISNTGAAVTLRTLGQANLNETAVVGIEADQGASTGLVVNASDQSRIADLLVTTSRFNNSNTDGLVLKATSSGELDGVAVTDVNVSATGATGATLSAVDTATVANISLDTVGATDTAGDGIRVVTGTQDGSDTATVNNVSVTDAVANKTSSAGIDIEAYAATSVTDIEVVTANVSTNTAGVGLGLAAYDNATVANASLDSITADGSVTGLQIQAGGAVGDDATVRNVTTTSSGLNETSSDGVVIKTDGAATATDIELSTISATATGGSAVVARSTGSGNLTGLNLTSIDAEGAASDGLRVVATSNGLVTDVDATDTILNKSTGGVNVTAAGSADISGISLDTINVSDSDDAVALTAVDTATVENVSGTQVIGKRASSAGLAVTGGTDDDGSSTATVRNVTMVDSVFNGSTARAIAVKSQGSGTVNELNLTNINASGPSQAALFGAFDSGTTENIIIDGVLARGAGTDGVTFVAGKTASSAATLQQVTVKNSGFNESSGAGVNLSAAGSSTLQTVTLDTIDATGGSEAAVVSTTGSATVSSVTVTSMLGESVSSDGFRVEATGSGSTIDSLSITDSVFNRTGRNGVNITAVDDATVSGVSLDTINASDTKKPVSFTARDTATIKTSTLTSIIGTRASTIGLAVTAGDAGDTASTGTVQDLSVSDSAFNESGGRTLDVQAAGNGTVSGLSLQSVNLSGSPSAIRIVALGEGTTEDVDIDSILARGSGGDAAVFRAGTTTGAAASLRNVTVTSAGFNESAGTGIVLTTNGSSSVSNVTFDTIDATGGTNAILAQSDASATMSDVTIDTVDGENVPGDGLRLDADDSSTVDGFTVRNTALNRTGGSGIAVVASSTSTVTGVELQTVNVSDNPEAVAFAANNDSRIANVSADEVLGTRAGTTALEIFAGDAGDTTSTGTIANVSISNAVFNETSTRPLNVQAAGNGTIDGVSLQTANLSGASGVRVVALGEATTAGVNLDSVIARGASGDAAVFRAGTDTSANASLRNVTVTSAGFNESAGTGIVLTTNGSSSVSNVTFDTIDATGGTDAVLVRSVASTTMSDVTIGPLNGENVPGDGLRLDVDDSSTVDGFTIQEAALNRTGGSGIAVVASSTATVTGVELQTVNVSDNPEAVSFAANNDSRIANVSADEVLGTRAGTTALEVVAGDAGDAASTGTIANVSISNAVFNETSTRPLNVQAAGNGTIDGLSLQTANLSGAGGVRVAALGDATAANVSFESVLARGSSADGIVFRAGTTTGAAATLRDVTVTSAGFNESAGTGIVLTTNGSSSVSNVTFDTIDATGGTDAVLVQSGATATVSGLTVDTVLGEGVPGDGFRAAVEDGSTLQNLTVTESALNQTGGTGIAVVASSTSTVTGVELQTVNVSDNTNAVTFAAYNDSSIANVSADEVLGTRASTGGLQTVAGDAGVTASAATVRNVSVTNSVFNESTGSGTGVTFTARGGATVADLSFDTLNISGTASGARIAALDEATVENVSLQTMLARGTSVNGIVFRAGTGTGANATLRDVTVTSAGFNESAGTGIVLTTNGSSSVSNVTFDTIDATDGTDAVFVRSGATATVSGLTVDTVLGEGASGDGLRVAVEDSSTLDDFTVRESAFNQTGGTGIAVVASSSATVTGPEIQTVNVSDNTNAVTFAAYNDSTIVNISADEVLGPRASTAGFRTVAGDADDTTSTATVRNVTLTNAVLNESTGIGATFTARGGATVADLSFDTLNISGTASGARIAALDEATVENVSVRTMLARGTSVNGIQFSSGAMLSANATVRNVTINTAGFNDSAGTGVAVLANGSSTFSGFTIDTADLSGNQRAVTVAATGSSTVSDVKVDTVLASEATQQGLFVVAGRPGTTDTATVEDLNVTTSGFNTTAATGAEGVSIGAAASSTVTNVSFGTVNVSDTSVGVELDTRDDGELTNVSLNLVQALRSDDAGVRIDATTSSGAPTVRNVSIIEAEANETASGPALGIAANSSAVVENVTVDTARFGGNDRGVQVNLSESATLDELTFNTTAFDDTTDAAIVLNESGSSTLTGFEFSRNLITDDQSGDGDRALVLAPETSPDGVTFQLNLIENTTVGVDNRNGSAVVDARYNFWGVDSGPGSIPSSPVVDPLSDELADGSGATVSEGATAGVSNVRFDPWLGKATCTDKNFQNVSSRVISYPEVRGISTDAVVSLCAWERAVLPFRTDGDDAATDVQLPSTFVETNETGSVPINRESLVVYQKGDQFTVTFDKTTGANTTQFAGDDVELLVVTGGENATQDVLTSNAFTFNQSTFTATVETNGTNLTLLEGSELPNNGELDGDGAISVDYTPSESTTYGFILLRRDYGEGLNITESGNVTINGGVDIIGVEQATVQDRNSTATPRNSTRVVGQNITFEVDSNLGGSSNTTHAVFVYNETRLADQTLTFAVDSITGSLVSRTVDFENATVRTSIAGFNGVVRVEDDTTLLGRTLTAGERSGNISTESFIETAFPNATTVIQSPSVRLDAAATVGTDRAASSTVTVETFANFSTGTYEFVHIAQRGSAFSTDSGTVTLTLPPQLNQPPNADAGGPYIVRENENVTLSGTGSGDPDGTIANYQWSITNDPSGSAQLVDAGSATPTFVAPDITSTTNVTVQLTVTDNDGATSLDTTRVRVRPSAAAGGGGGGAGGEGPSADFQVDATISETEISPGDTVTIEYTVRNAGPIGGIYEARLIVDGARTGQTNTFDISPDGVVQSSFQLTLQEEGEYDIAITNTPIGVIRVTGENTTDVVSVRGTGRTFDFPRGPVTRLEFDRLQSGKFTVATLNRIPRGLPEAPGTVVTPFNITVPEDARDQSARVTFAVNRSRLDDLGLSPDQIALARYDDESGEWQVLETTPVNTSGARLTFRATTPGFSTFAIVGLQDEETPVTPTDTPVTPTETPTTPPTETPTTPPTDETPARPGGIGGLAIGLLLLLVLLAVLGLLYLYGKREDAPQWLQDAVDRTDERIDELTARLNEALDRGGAGGQDRLAEPGDDTGGDDAGSDTDSDDGDGANPFDYDNDDN